ncbi:hypothetical protein FHX42_004168 [Saccharopolyspora lacisalsi]|uniref:Uncharacterized protein n=1 Tax=Halosaccharopolyspora lacisalsi TaxID=1000566 RepID=A0A839E1M0_9PSEU|nr:hypothetical protein [Halosaccharopolyspora lacisalsi]MBA8826789.1 hypothetical protein [Halosaccharopolyspora lacisalsi]
MMPAPVSAMVPTRVSPLRIMPPPANSMISPAPRAFTSRQRGSVPAIAINSSAGRHAGHPGLSNIDKRYRADRSERGGAQGS